jgi:UDP-glucuronate 4-epimerase
MAPYLFTDAIANGRPIKVFNDGKMQRDFTYIDDIVEGVIRIQDVIPSQDNDGWVDGMSPHYRIYNIGNNQPVELEEFIRCIENALDKQAVKNYMPMQDGDVVRTYADVSALESVTKFKPNTELQSGIKEFVKWYQEYVN